MKGSNLIKIGLSLVLVYILIRQLDFGEIDLTNIKFSASSVLVIISLFILTYISRAYRWYMIVNDGYSSVEEKVSFWNSIKFLMIGCSLNLVLPSGAGDIAKGYFASKELGDANRMYLASVHDKVIAISSLFLLSFQGWYFDNNIWILIAGLCSLIPIVLIILFPLILRLKFIEYFLKKFKNKRVESIKRILGIGLKMNFKTFLTSVFLSLFGWVCTYLILYHCFLIVGGGVSAGEVIANSPMLTLGRLFPFTLNGLGSDEMLTVYLFESKFLTKEVILIAAMIYRFILMIVSALIGLPFIMASKTKKEVV